jgi:hypothetical protein
MAIYTNTHLKITNELYWTNAGLFKAKTGCYEEPAKLLLRIKSQRAAVGKL